MAEPSFLHKDAVKAMEGPQRREYIVRTLKDELYKLVRQYSDGSPEEMDVIMIELVHYLIFSATHLQRNAVGCKDLGVQPEGAAEALKKLYELELPPEVFRGSREV
jgi:hypothetical protein